MDFNVDNYVLLIVHTPYSSTSTEAIEVMDTVENMYSNSIIGGDIYTDNQPIIPTYLIVLAFIILMVLLLVFTTSWIEPFLFLITIGIAIIINMGTNVVFDSVSTITFSIAALLQLCLSIDYSIILLNRYRQEKKNESDNKKAMKNAMYNAYSSIAGSSFTTIVGLLCLIFMSFSIGADMGLVLAKGVFISLLSVFFVLPALIILFDKLIEKTQKRSLHIGTKRLSQFSYKARKVIPFVFILVLVGSFFLRDSTEIGYVIPIVSSDEASEIFPDKNVILVLYDNDDETEMIDIVSDLESNADIISVQSFSNTIGLKYNDSEIAYITNMDQSMVSGIFMAAGVESMSIYDYLVFVSTNFSNMLSNDQLVQLNQFILIMEANKEQLVGDEYSRMIITSNLEPDSKEIDEFITDFNAVLNTNLDNTFYLLGDSVMASEISHDFDSEFLTITLVTVISIFIIVALTFKSIAIPLILVSVIQTAIFLTTGALGLFGDNVYFLALLIVQAILMGATIDYGILFTSYFREKGSEVSTKEALDYAYNGSIHTIMTSASILFLVTGILSVIATDPTITQVLKALAVGTMSSTLLILFALPPILVLVSKLIMNRKTKKVLQKN